VSSSRYRDGVRAIAPLAVPAFLFAVSFGVLARAAGMGVGPTLLMSLTTFAGSAQFAVVSVLEDGGTIAAAVTAALLLNGRYGAISVSVGSIFRGGLVRRVGEAQMIVDESWAVANRGRGRFDYHILVGAGLGLYVCWNAGTALGAFGGGLIGDPGRLGLDAAFPALFLALLVTFVGRRTWLPAVVGGLVALALIPVAPPGVPIIAASAACLLGLRR
jgi:predicted branched-subunit amino acid permease